MLLLTSHAAFAYEGTSDLPPEQQQPPPKAPQLTKAPTVKQAVKAPYPPELISDKSPTGQVHLIVEIDAAGHVPNATVSQPSGYPAMDAAALAAIKQFQFTPAELDGKPAAIRLEYVFNFEPPPPPPPPPPPNVPPPPPPVNLRGRVLERGTRDPLPGAVVAVPDAGLETQTDADGHFELHGVPTGKVRIHIEEPGHDPFNTTEEIRAGEVTELTAYAWKRLDARHTTTVHGDREKKEVSRRTLEKEELTTAPGSAGDPVRVLEDMPGVARPPYEMGQLIIRGSSPNDTGVYIDGVPVPVLFHFAGGPSVINPALVDQMDFYAGGFGAKYGRAIGGVVDVSTKEPDAKRLHGSLSVDMIQSNFFLEGPVRSDKDWGTWTIAARRSYLDSYLSSVLGWLQSPGSAAIVAAPRYWDYQARYALKRGRDSFQLLLFGGDDRLVLAEAGSVDAQGFSVNEHDGFNRAVFKWRHKFDNGWNFLLQPVFGDTQLNGGFSGQVGAEIFSWDLNLRSSLSKRFSDQLAVEFGFDSMTNWYTLSFLFPEVPDYRGFPSEYPNLPIVQQNLYKTYASEGVYAEVVWTPWRGLKIVPGVRLELYELPGHLLIPSVEPRLSVRYEFTPRTAVKAAFGMYRESPQPISVEAQFGTVSNGLPQASQTVLGFEQKFTDTLSLDVQGFYNWRTHLLPEPNYNNPPNTIGGAISNDEFGRSYGVEVLLKQALTARMYGWISYTFSRSENWDFPTHQFLPYDYDQTHLLTVVASYKLNWGIQIGARYRFTSGRPDFPVLGNTYDADLNLYNAVTGTWGAVRTPNFSQFDLRIDKLWTFERWRFSIYLDVQNVLNASNPEFTIYDYRYRQSAPLRGLPILPTLGMTGSF